MTDDDAKFEEWSRLWRNQRAPLPQERSEDVLKKVKERSRKFDRTIAWRDVREAVAGLFGAGVMVWVSWLAPGWLPKIGAAAATAGVLYVVAQLSRVRRRHALVREDLPLVERLRAEIAKVEAQADLLRSVRSWYVTPLAVGSTLWLASLVPAIGMPVGATAVGLVGAILFSTLLFCGVGWVVVKINARAVRTELEPYRDELRRMLGG
jgi:hypothetical protein